MPILNVLLSGPAHVDTTRNVAAMLSDLTARLLHKKPELTSIAVRYESPRESRRLLTLRRWSHEQQEVQPLFTRSP